MNWIKKIQMCLTLIVTDYTWIMFASYRVGKLNKLRDIFLLRVNVERTVHKLLISILCILLCILPITTKYPSTCCTAYQSASVMYSSTQGCTISTTGQRSNLYEFIFRAVLCESSGRTQGAIIITCFLVLPDPVLLTNF